MSTPKWVTPTLWGAGLLGGGAAVALLWLKLARDEAPPAPAEVQAAEKAMPPQSTEPPAATYSGAGYVNGKSSNISLTPVGNGKMLRTDAAQAFNAMREAAAADGINLTVISGFRTNEEQQHLYAGWKAKLPGFNLAAAPGYSNHQGGVSTDLNTGGFTTKTYRWLFSNAKRFGFVNDVKSEHWHWTFKGGGSGVAGLRGVGAEPVPGMSLSRESGRLTWIVPAAFAGIVVYQMFIRPDEGPKTVGTRPPNAKKAEETKRRMVAKGMLPASSLAVPAASR